MATNDLTAKKRSDLRVAALRRAAAPGSDSRPSASVGAASVVEAELMPPPELLEQARALVARFDGLADRMPDPLDGAGAPVLAEVLPIFDLPVLPVDGETSQLDAKGRFACTAARTLLGWGPQDLTVPPVVDQQAEQTKRGAGLWVCMPQVLLDHGGGTLADLLGLLVEPDPLGEVKCAGEQLDRGLDGWPPFAQVEVAGDRDVGPITSASVSAVEQQIGQPCLCTAGCAAGSTTAAHKATVSSSTCSSGSG